MCKMNQQRKSCSSKRNLGMSWISMHSTERTRPEPTESEKKESKPNAAKILRAEKFDVSQQNKNKCRRKTIFLETNQKNLAEEMKAECPSFYMLCCFLFSRRKFRSFHFSYFPARNVFISLEYIIGISYWARKTILTEKYETWFPTEDHAYIIMISRLMKWLTEALVLLDYLDYLDYPDYLDHLDYLDYPDYLDYLD